LRADICGALGLSWSADEPLPVTYFTDIRCPSCRQLEARLAALAADPATRMRLTTREFPVFGPRSEAAARAIVAAAPFGAAERFRARLRTRPAPADRPGLRALAGSLGVDPDAYLASWQDPATLARLAEDRALARLIGLPGTPGLVVGRTVTVGVQPRDTLRHLMRVESQDGPPAACA
jgi:protein-disulfide isomerase